MEGHRKLKIGRIVTLFRGRKVKVKVIKPIIAERENAPYLLAERPTNLKLSTVEYVDPHHRHAR